MVEHFAQLKYSSVNPAERVRRLGERMEVIDNWPILGEARKRIAPSVIPMLYKGGHRAEQWGREWCQSKGVPLSGPLGKLVLRTCIALDFFILFEPMDKPFNALNSPGVEVLVRDLYGLQKSFANVSPGSGAISEESEAGKPKPGQKRKANAVQWARRDEYDVAAIVQSELTCTAADAEVQKRAARRAAYEKYVSKAHDGDGK